MKVLLLGGVALLLAGCNQGSNVAETKQELKAVEAKVEPVKAPEPVVEVKPVILPQGTRLRVRTTTTLSTKTVRPGEGFSASLAEPLIVDGKTVLEKGADIDGAVMEVDEGGRVKGVASISLRITSVEIGGKKVPLKSSLYVKAAPATKKKDALKVGIGAGVGAAIGAIAGGGKGAAIGAASGAGAGTGVVLATRGEPAEIPAESVISFRLAAPLEVAQ